MNEIKALDKLRELVSDINAKEIVDHMQLYPSAVFDCMWLDSWHSEFNRLVESLEAEIADNYMRLPVDADGVPIHVGDAITLPNGSRDDVRFITIRKYDTVLNERGWVSSQCTHVKPRTLEDVLREFAENAVCCNQFGSLYADEKRIAECADEIRELLGGDAE